MTGKPGHAVVSVDAIGHSYGVRRVIERVSFDVYSGERYVLVGANGAGKTTLLEMVLGLIRPDRGTVRVLGHDPARANHHARAHVGGVIDGTTPEPSLTVREALRLFASYHGPTKSEDALERSGLAACGDLRVSVLSVGERNRLRLALALLGRPLLLVLDEPTSGFDPAARQAVWDLIEGLCDGGAAVLLATQVFAEAEDLATRVGILDGGRLVAEGEPSVLVASFPSYISYSASPTQGFAMGPPEIRDRIERAHESVRIASDSPEADLRALLRWAERTGVELRDLEVRMPRLEDAYARAVGTGPATRSVHDGRDKHGR